MLWRNGAILWKDENTLGVPYLSLGEGKWNLCLPSWADIYSAPHPPQTSQANREHWETTGWG